MTKSLHVHNQSILVGRGPIRVARLEHEWYEDIVDPVGTIARLREKPVKADLFTFWQRPPDLTPHHSYYWEWDAIAALPISSYEHWWSTQIKSRTRGIIRKAAKEGVEVREVDFSDDFVRGMVAIFNESPIRQGRPFWHYGKDFDTVKHQFSRYLFREHLLGAFHRSELIGFMMLGVADRYAVTGQIISKLSERDKGVNNALIAKAVELCARRGLESLVYVRWDDGSLAEFKRRNGFEKVDVPRYYVPLSAKGALALRVGCHAGFSRLMPQRSLARLKQLRTAAYRAIYSVKYRHAVTQLES